VTETMSMLKPSRAALGCGPLLLLCFPIILDGLFMLYRIREVFVGILGLARHDKPDRLPKIEAQALPFQKGERAILFHRAGCLRGCLLGRPDTPVQAFNSLLRCGCRRTGWRPQSILRIYSGELSSLDRPGVFQYHKVVSPSCGEQHDASGGSTMLHGVYPGRGPNGKISDLE
jgi:hypothetical protein